MARWKDRDGYSSLVLGGGLVIDLTLVPPLVVVRLPNEDESIAEWTLPAHAVELPAAKLFATAKAAEWLIAMAGEICGTDPNEHE